MFLSLSLSLSEEMPYQYFGQTSLCQGKPLFKILCRLKDFGRGRIVYR